MELELEFVEVDMVETMYNPKQEENLGQNLVVMCHRFAGWLNAFVSLYGGFKQLNNYQHSISSCLNPRQLNNLA